MLIHKKLLALTLALAASSLGGCTIEMPARASAPEPTTAQPTESSTPPAPAKSAPTAPAELERTDEAGAVAAAEYFLELWSYTMQTGDVMAWDTMSEEFCEFCRWTRAIAVSIDEAGDTFTGGDIKPMETYLHPFDEAAGAYPVDVDFLQSPSERHSVSGRLVSADSETYGTLGVDVIRLDDGWKVLEVTAQSGP